MLGRELIGPSNLSLVNAAGQPPLLRRHNEGAVYVYADGHVSVLPWKQVRNVLPPALTRFVQPNN